MKTLTDLSSDELQLFIGCVSTASGLRMALEKSEQVKAVRMAIESGELSEKAIEDFVNGLLADFKPGISFPHETALAAVAIALETHPTEFAQMFLTDLAKLKDITEIYLAPRMADICLEERAKRDEQK